MGFRKKLLKFIDKIGPSSILCYPYPAFTFVEAANEN